MLDCVIVDTVAVIGLMCRVVVVIAILVVVAITIVVTVVVTFVVVDRRGHRN